MKKRELITRLIRHGWFLEREGKHEVYRHPTRLDEIAISRSTKELPKGTVEKILKQAGLK